MSDNQTGITALSLKKGSSAAYETETATDTYEDIEDTTSWTEYSFVGLGVLGILLNLLVLYIAIRHIDLQQKLSQIFVVCMTTCDLLFALTYIVTRPWISQFPLVMCGPYYVVLWACMVGSVVFLLYLNIDKFLALYYPLHYPSMITQTKVVAQASITCALLLLYMTFCYYWMPDSFIEHRKNISGPQLDCTTVIKIQTLYYGIYTTVGYILPILLSLCISVYIFIIATRAGSGFVAGTASAGGGGNSMGITGDKTAVVNSSVHRRNQRRRKQLFYRILFVFSSTLWTSMTVLPYRLSFALYNFCAYHCVKCNYGEGDRCSPPFFYTLMWAFVKILAVGTIGNPIITIVTQRVYRRHLMWMMAGCCRCLIPAQIRLPSMRHLWYEDELATDRSMMASEFGGPEGVGGIVKCIGGGSQSYGGRSVRCRGGGVGCRFDNKRSMSVMNPKAHYNNNNKNSSSSGKTKIVAGSATAVEQRRNRLLQPEQGGQAAVKRGEDETAAVNDVGGREAEADQEEELQGINKTPSHTCFTVV